MRTPLPAGELNKRLWDEHGIIGGYDLGQDYAHLQNHMLLCVTEMNSKEEIDALVSTLAEVQEA